MTLAPDTADLAAPDPSDYRPVRRKAGLPGVVWALIAFGAVCVLAGILVAAYGPRLWPARPATEAAPPISPSPPSQQTATAAPPPAPGLAGALPPPASVAPSDVQVLEARLAALEAVQARTADAVAASLTAAALSSAAQDSQPFEAEAAAAMRALPLSADARALTRLAAAGAPSRAELQAGFAAAAARAVVAQRDPGPQAGLAARVLHALSSVVSIRRVEASAGTGVDAVLARAEQQTAQGDLEGALETIETLPEGPQAAFQTWREGAQRRVEIDRRIASLRDLALAELDRALRSRP